MKRSEKAALLTQLMQGNLKRDTAKRLLNPVPLSCCGVLILCGQEPHPTDAISANLTFSGGGIKERQMTFQEFEQLPESTHKTLFILPDNHR